MINCSSFTDRRGHQRRVTLFCVLGDAHLDVVVCPEGPVAEETDTPARTWVGAGGQAANVAAWIAAPRGRAPAPPPPAPPPTPPPLPCAPAHPARGPVRPAGDRPP